LYLCCAPQSACPHAILSFPTLFPLARYPPSLHDALPILAADRTVVPVARIPGADAPPQVARVVGAMGPVSVIAKPPHPAVVASSDRKSTRLNSSHVENSYAVFCLKKKTKKRTS